MTQKTKRLLSLVLVSAAMGMVSPYGYAQTQVEDTLLVGEPQYGGTGCPEGTAYAFLAEDQQSLGIYFDAFNTKAGKINGKRIDRKACGMAIPVHVPEGMSLSILEVTYQGDYALPKGAKTQIIAESFFVGSQSIKYSKTFTGAQEGMFQLKKPVLVSAQVDSACGKDVILRTQVSLTTQTNSRKETTTAQLQGMELDSGLIYRIQLKKCEATL